MTTQNTERLLQFAFSLDSPKAGNTPSDCARNRGWLDDAGNLTTDGARMLEALGGQSKQRTVFRIG